MAARVDCVIPVYNEEHVLENSIGALRDFLKANLPYTYRILVADNASTDGTLALARKLSERWEDVDVLHIPQKGRGRALRKAWLESEADAVSYMDVDLSTDINSYPALIKAILEDGYDVSFGTRLGKGSKTTRSFKRQFISRTYNFMIKAFMWTRFTDAQCGFKAISRQAAQELIPLIENEEWFFDTELLILAEKGGYRYKEVPVKWLEDPDTRVNLRKTIQEDIDGLWRMKRQKKWKSVSKRPAR